MAALATQHPLLARVAAPDNLRAAWDRVRAKRAAGGLDGQSVDAFDADRDRHLDQLRRELVHQSYVPEPVQSIAIPKPNKPGERRTLGLPAVRDKVAQEAVRRVIEPRFERIFFDCSYGYRPGRGPQRAVKRVSHYLNSEKCGWVVDVDIDDFFPSLDHDRLLGALRPLLQDEAVVRLLALWLQMGAVDRTGSWRDVYSGVQQGSVVAPMLANFYLQPFDQSMLSQGFRLVRYADDMVICCRSQDDAERALERARTFLGERLSLQFNRNPRPVVAADEGFAFLGIWFCGTSRSLPATKAESSRFRLGRIVAGGGTRQERLRKIGEAAAGWRRYYATLLSADALEPLVDEVVAAAAQVLQADAGHGRLDRAGAMEAVRHLEFPAEPSSEQREGLLQEIVRRAFPPAEARAPKKPRRPSAPAPRRSGGRASTAPASPAAATDRPPPSVAAVVRRRKRQQLRRHVSSAELIVDEPGSFIGKSGQRLAVRRVRQRVCEVSVEALQHVTIARQGVSMSADAIELCAQRGIPVFFLSPLGTTLAVAQAPGWCDGETAVAQLRAIVAERPALALASRFVAAKIRSQMRLLQYLRKSRRCREGGLDGELVAALAAMSALVAEAEREASAADAEGVRGRLFSIEGRAAGFYWQVVQRQLAPRVEFPGRQRKGASDLVNSMLNYGYAVLRSRVLVAIERAGLNPHLSFLHAMRPGEPTLAFDLMEQFRPPVVDRTVLALLGRGGGCALAADGRLDDRTRVALLRALVARLASLVQYKGARHTLAEAIGRDADGLARHLRTGRRYRPLAARW